MSFFLPHFVKVILLLGFLWLFARRIFVFVFLDGLGSERDVTARTPSFLGKLECLPLFYFILMPRVVISARAIYNIYIFKFRQNQVGANSSIICFMYTTAPLYSLDRFKSLETSSAHSSDWSSFQHSIFRRSVVNFTFWNKGSVFLRFYARTFLQSIRVSRSVWARLLVFELVRFLLVVHWELALLFHGAWRLISIELGGFKEHFFFYSNFAPWYSCRVSFYADFICTEVRNKAKVSLETTAVNLYFSTLSLTGQAGPSLRSLL